PGPAARRRGGAAYGGSVDRLERVGQGALADRDAVSRLASAEADRQRGQGAVDHHVARGLAPAVEVRAQLGLELAGVEDEPAALVAERDRAEVGVRVAAEEGLHGRHVDLVERPGGEVRERGPELLGAVLQ